MNCESSGNMSCSLSSTLPEKMAGTKIGIICVTQETLSLFEDFYPAETVFNITILNTHEGFV